MLFDFFLILFITMPVFYCDNVLQSKQITQDHKSLDFEVYMDQTEGRDKGLLYLTDEKLAEQLVLFEKSGE